MDNIEKNSGFDFSSFSLFGYMLKRFRFLVAVCITAAVLSAVASFLITPRFKSKVVLFPASSASISQLLLTDNISSRAGGLQNFGEEEEAEQVLQVLSSNVIKDKMIEKYDLLHHYKVKPDSKYRKTQLYDHFENNVKFHRTELNSIEIVVLDKDPIIAANMANDISALLDTVMNQMRKERALQAFKIVESEYKSYLTIVKLMEDSINDMRKKGINHYELTVDRLMEGYSKALINNNPSAAEKINKRLRDISPYATRYVSLRERLGNEYGELANLKVRYLAMKVELEEMLPTKYVVDRAFPAEKKAYPLRSLIVIISVFAALIFGLFAALIFDNWNRLKSQIS